jgi:hypothetical protein
MGLLTKEGYVDEGETLVDQICKVEGFIAKVEEELSEIESCGEVSLEIEI